MEYLYPRYYTEPTNEMISFQQNVQRISSSARYHLYESEGMLTDFQVLEKLHSNDLNFDARLMSYLKQLENCFKKNSHEFVDF